MFRQWRPLGEELGTFPGLDVEVRGREVTVVWDEWVNGVCVFRMRAAFGPSLASLRIWDESSVGFDPQPPVADSEFDPNEPGHYNAHVEHASAVLESYNEYARMMYKRIDRYFLWGQEIVVMLDIADCDPVVTIEVPRAAGHGA
ncbi:hypothetical protein [Arenimonas sp.]|uniref:hypothetical protein n=1 Tax=Arenimonas sp. TaxID=1872635 RepID=UPI0025C4DAA6|nr:hypothetical protein [Arenimonas sp.]